MPSGKMPPPSIEPHWSKLNRVTPSLLSHLRDGEVARF